MSTVSVPNGMLLRWAWCSTRLTPQAAMPAMNDSPVLTASPGPDGESITQWLVRAEFSVRPRTSVVFERVEYLFLISAMIRPPQTVGDRIQESGDRRKKPRLLGGSSNCPALLAPGSWLLTPRPQARQVRPDQARLAALL